MSNGFAKLLDCTLRDGGYYCDWDFEPALVEFYFEAMAALKVDYVELGLRSLKNSGFKGGFAYTTDSFLDDLDIPIELHNKIGVMVNASELVSDVDDVFSVLQSLFAPKKDSLVTLVRVACHVDEFNKVLPAAKWLKEQGYLVGFNLMQVADRNDDEIAALARQASENPIDVLYFADSMGSLAPAQVQHIVGVIRGSWAGEIGIHTHDNMSQALANSMAAINSGATWVDSTVTGMGRGPGNVQTEYLALALESYREQTGSITPLLKLVNQYFKPMQVKYGWGSNSYYYLAGKFGIHPTYIQHMLADIRFTEEDVLAVIDHLKVRGGKKFSMHALDLARDLYSGEPNGKWEPETQLGNKEVLLLGTGQGVEKHRAAIENYIRIHNPIVVALNTQSSIEQGLITLRVACHPIRLLADCQVHANLSQPLITPVTMLSQEVKEVLAGKELYDFGLQVQAGEFNVSSSHCTVPTSLVMMYALAVAASGKASKVLLAGFDGYPAGDPRNAETMQLFEMFQESPGSIPLLSITPTIYRLPTVSVYGLLSK